MRKLCTLILSVLTIMAAFTIAVQAESEVTNISTNVNVKTFQAGDTVTVQVSTKEMSICTFIAYVEYNADLLEYQGFYAPDGSKTVYLARKKNANAKVTVTVEASEEGSIIGMYSVGTKEYVYSEASPLVTLEFKAKSSGTVTKDTFEVAETSDGEDGFTSESIKQAAAEANADTDATDATTATGASGNKDSNQAGSSSTGVVITIIIILAIALTAIIIYIIKKRHK